MMSALRTRGMSMDRLTARFVVTLLVAALVALFAPSESFAQDTHYWANQLGNRARLLGGAVVGNPGDLSAVY